MAVNRMRQEKIEELNKVGIGIYFNKRGKMIGLGDYMKLVDKGIDYKRVDETTLPNGKWVSTVWLGLDHRNSYSSKPMIFETAVFPNRKDFSEIDMERYSTLEEAKKGHERMVIKWTEEK